ncbi:MAG TPA: hypothetical protein VGO09_06250 [Flavisolibacter sp.]|nr:hypothetical protein [Flavisolibacter sp.]
MNAQEIQTIVRNDSVVTGTAFQVQYIIANPTELTRVIPPSFDSMQLISGPHYYKGTAIIEGKPQPIENITYTLVPLVKGLIKLGGITAQFKNGTDKKSNDVFIKAISPPKASYNTRSTFTDINLYASGSKAEVEKIIADNIFIKTEVSKKTSYLGEPIVVSFKLYSGLQSSSEAAKAPGLYGFSMIDMLDINEPHIGIEKLNGKVFNTAVLRQMQLYPLQPGRLVIDPVYVENNIEFYDSVHSGKKINIRKELISRAIPVLILPLPSKQPDSYTGAVGEFILNARIKDPSIPLNKQGKLIISIKGKGNFIQFGMPFIKAPKGIYFNETTIADSLNKGVAPEEGERIYELAFTPDSIGSYKIPSISFSFFDVKKAVYKTIQSDSIGFKIIPSEHSKNNLIIDGHSKPVVHWFWLLLFSMACIVILFFGLVTFKKRKKPVIAEEIVNNIDFSQQIIELYEGNYSSREFYAGLQKILTQYLEKNKENTDRVDEPETLNIINECQLLIYSEIEMPDKLEELKTRAIEVVEGTVKGKG